MNDSNEYVPGDYPPFDGIFVSREDVQRLFQLSSIAKEARKCIEQHKDGDVNDGACTMGSL